LKLLPVGPLAGRKGGMRRAWQTFFQCETKKIDAIEKIFFKFFLNPNLKAIFWCIGYHTPPHLLLKATISAKA
jgi:hypothetical protein